jgi:hypothetical protein
MSKPLILFILGGALSFAQTQADPADETKKTARQKGYHETSPKNTGPTSQEAKDKSAKDKKASDAKGNDALGTATPPTRQPEVTPPNKP